MPAGEYEALLRRIATLESQVRQLREIIDLRGNNLTIRSPGRLDMYVGGTMEVEVGGALGLYSGARMEVESSAALDISASGAVSLKSDQSASIAAISLSAAFASDVTIKAGRNFDTKVNKKYVLEADDAVTVKTGSTDIQMKKDGAMHLDGKDIEIKATGKLQAKASGDVIIKGSKILQN